MRGRKKIRNSRPARATRGLVSNKINKPGTVAHIFNLSSQEAVTHESLCDLDQPGLSIKFQASYSYRETLFQNRQKIKNYYDYFKIL